MNLKKWLIYNALGMTFALFLALAIDSIVWLLLIAFSSFIFLFYHTIPVERKTYANQITAFRFLLSSITALAFVYLAPLWAFFLFGTAIALDGLDGYLARKYNQVTELGGLFDMTTDAYLVLILSFLLVKNYELSYWVLGIGYLHYGYTLLIYFLKWQNLSIPKNPVGKYIAAFLFLSLLSPFIISSDWYSPIIYLSSSLTACSFMLSFWLKYKASVIY